MKNSNKIVFLISLTGFIFLSIYFNLEKKGMSDFFKLDEELFLNDFSPIEMEKYKYLGELADTTNHMYPYMNFGKVCLPVLSQWKDKIKIGDYVSKKKDSLTLFIETKTSSYFLHLDRTGIGSAPSACKCEKLSK